MDKDKLLANPKGFCTDKYIRLHFPEEYICIQQCEGRTFTERLYNYWYRNGRAKRCIQCNKELATFGNIRTGYGDYCSRRCSCNSDKRTENMRTTNRQRYGVDNVSQVLSVKEKKRSTVTDHYGGFGFRSKELTERYKHTIQQRYGVDNVSQAPSVKEKKRSTTLVRYGVDHPLQSTEVRDKMQQTCIDRYGVRNIFLLDSVKKKSKEHYYQRCWRHREYIIDIINKDHVYYLCSCPHPECTLCKEKTFEIRSNLYRDRIRTNTELCTKLLPYQPSISTYELNIRKILEEHNIVFQTNVRDVISPKELDIYIPSHHLAIECNGVYWHSTHNKEALYHYEKFKACQEKGIQLLTFWEDQIKTKPEIIKSIICSKLGLYDNKIGARQCKIKEIDSKTSKTFIDTYHIQGSTNSKIRLGLYYHDDLISVMTFSHRKGGQGRGITGWILDRYCVRAGWKISGGAMKMLMFFIRRYGPEEITSFASNDISVGHLYECLGFKKVGVSSSYWYIDTLFNRYHRSSFTKAAIVRRGWKNEISKDWTEAEVLQEHNYYRIYDSGTTKYVLNVNRLLL